MSSTLPSSVFDRHAVLWFTRGYLATFTRRMVQDNFIVDIILFYEVLMHVIVHQKTPQSVGLATGKSVAAKELYGQGESALLDVVESPAGMTPALMRDAADARPPSKEVYFYGVSFTGLTATGPALDGVMPLVRGEGGPLECERVFSDH